MPPGPETRGIWCCNCNAIMPLRLTNGAECYPHRPDLADRPLWRCPGCKAWVGTHHKNKADPTAPLGVVPTPELRDARIKLHALMDPLFQSGAMKRGRLYQRIGLELGREYHTGEIRTLEEAREVWRIVKAIIDELNSAGRNTTDGGQD